MPISKEENVTKTVVFLVTPEMKEEILRRAAEDRRSMGDYLRLILSDAFVAKKEAADD